MFICCRELALQTGFGEMDLDVDLYLLLPLRCGGSGGGGGGGGNFLIDVDCCLGGRFPVPTLTVCSRPAVGCLSSAHGSSVARSVLFSTVMGRLF